MARASHLDSDDAPAAVAGRPATLPTLRTDPDTPAGPDALLPSPTRR